MLQQPKINYKMTKHNIYPFKPPFVDGSSQIPPSQQPSQANNQSAEEPLVTPDVSSIPNSQNNSQASSQGVSQAMSQTNSQANSQSMFGFSQGSQATQVGYLYLYSFCFFS